MYTAISRATVIVHAKASVKLRASTNSRIKSLRCIHCIGCGSHLSLERLHHVMEKPKLNMVPNTESVKFKLQQKMNEDILPQMSSDQKKALNWEFNPSTHITLYEQQVNNATTKLEQAKNSKMCKICRISREGSITPIVAPTYPSIISPNSRIFHVVDALDFPMGIPDLHMATEHPKEFSAKYSDHIFVINRCDLLVAHHSQLQLLKKYFMLNFFYKRGIKDAKVVLVSSSKEWNLKKLSELFARNTNVKNYFVGATNSGKTRVVHALSGTDKLPGVGASTWPLPYTTQKPAEYTSLQVFRAKPLVDFPSYTNATYPTGILGLLKPSILRKICSGLKMTDKSPKYAAPKILGKTGQCISIGGLIAIEFPAVDSHPEKRLPFHVFCNIGGINHTEYLQAFKNIETVTKVNKSTHQNHVKMKMHDNLDLELTPKLSFEPLLQSGERQSVVIKGMGFLQPYLFGNFPPYYTVRVWAPDSAELSIRKEILPHIIKKK